MSEYLIFAFGNSPHGGIYDLVAIGENLTQSKKEALKHLKEYDAVQILSVRTKVVYEMSDVVPRSKRKWTTRSVGWALMEDFFISEEK